MAFLKHASGQIVHRNFSPENWGNFIGRNRGRLATGPYRTASSSPNLIMQASEILGEEFNPERFLLTHSTIVASVDTDDVANVKVGQVLENGRRVLRKYADFRITPETEMWTNNNGDSWARQTLLKSYRTFIGAHNFLEHCQREELSKGRIVDAVARDIGSSVYVDILVATDRRHTELVQDIESGRLGTLSMGCFLPDAQVSLSDGTRVSIRDVQPGDSVLSHLGNAREVVNRQEYTSRWNMRTIQAVGLSSPVTCTTTHPVFVVRPRSVCACGCGEALSTAHQQVGRRLTARFKRGHDKRVLNPNGSYSLDEMRGRRAQMDSIEAFQIEEVPAGDLRVGDFLCFPRRTVDICEGAPSVGRARLLGYFLAEGSFLKSVGNKVETQFNFALKERDTYVAEVCRLLREEFPGCNPWIQDRPDRNTSTVHVYGREIAEWFFAHGGEYSHGKRLSAEAMSWPTNRLLHVVGAWINGDGAEGEYESGVRHIAGTSTSYSLACQAHDILMSSGVFCRFQAKLGGRHATVAEVVNGPGLGGIHVESGRHPVFAVELGMTMGGLLGEFTDRLPKVPEKVQKWRVLDDYVIFPIREIDDLIYEGTVYDLEVETDHSYLVEGCAVHNCSCLETTCTKCGNVAVDETELCDHIRFEKRNHFFDERGQRRIIAELCGHPTIDPTAGITFIEASWVAVPAFEGAVLRNVLEPETISLNTQNRLRQVLASPPTQWVREGEQPKAAAMTTPSRWPATRMDSDPSIPERMLVQRRIAERRIAEYGEPGSDDGTDGGAEEAKEDPFSKLEDEVEKMLLDRVKSRIKDKMNEKNRSDAADGELATSTGDNIIHQGSRKKLAKLVEGTDAIMRIARSDVELIDNLARFETSVGIKISRDVYRTALRVGSTDGYGSFEKYLKRCAEVLGRSPQTGEAKTLVRLGRLISLHSKRTRS